MYIFIRVYDHIIESHNILTMHHFHGLYLNLKFFHLILVKTLSADDLTLKHINTFDCYNIASLSVLTFIDLSEGAFPKKVTLLVHESIVQYPLRFLGKLL